MHGSSALIAASVPRGYERPNGSFRFDVWRNLRAPRDDAIGTDQRRSRIGEPESRLEGVFRWEREVSPDEYGLYRGAGPQLIHAGLAESST
jgi:hypothetical protein